MTNYTGNAHIFAKYTTVKPIVSTSHTKSTVGHYQKMHGNEHTQQLPISISHAAVSTPAAARYMADWL